jgi:hypothetical protein
MLDGLVGRPLTEGPCAVAIGAGAGGMETAFSAAAGSEGASGDTVERVGNGGCVEAGGTASFGVALGPAVCALPSGSADATAGGRAGFAPATGAEAGSSVLAGAFATCGVAVSASAAGAGFPIAGKAVPRGACAIMSRRGDPMAGRTSDRTGTGGEVLSKSARSSSPLVGCTGRA